MSSGGWIVLVLLVALTAWLVWLGTKEHEEHYWSGVRDIYDEIEAHRVEMARQDAHARVQQDRADEVALLEQMLHGEDR
jgi:hypothetical protein